MIPSILPAKARLPSGVIMIPSILPAGLMSVKLKVKRISRLSEWEWNQWAPENRKDNPPWRIEFRRPWRRKTELIILVNSVLPGWAVGDPARVLLSVKDTERI